MHILMLNNGSPARRRHGQGQPCPPRTILLNAGTGNRSAHIGVSVLSIVLAVIYAVERLLYGLSPPGFATLIVSIFFLAGIQLIMMGAMGESVERIFEEVKRRPLYAVRCVTRG